jgi:hypothetical protein
VRAEPRDDTTIGGALLLEKGGGLGELFLAARFVAELDDAIGDNGAKAGILHRRGDLLGEEILVAEGRGAREHHLGTGERNRRPDIGADQRQLGLADRIVPSLHGEEALAFGAAAEQHHRRMGVGVDQAGHDQMPGKVEHLVIAGEIGRGGTRSDATDPSVANGHPAILEDTVLSVHGEHGAPVDKR